MEPMLKELILAAVMLALVLCLRRDRTRGVGVAGRKHFSNHGHE